MKGKSFMSTIASIGISLLATLILYVSTIIFWQTISIESGSDGYDWQGFGKALF